MEEDIKRKDNVEIEWKKHDRFYDSLNFKMDEISEIGELCYVQKDNIYIYFAKVKHLFNKHYAYIYNRENKKKRLKEIEKILYNPSFKKDLSEKRANAELMLFNIFDKLQDIYTEMVEDFTNPELIPKPKMKEVEAWEEEKDTKKKVMYKTVVKMFENV